MNAAREASVITRWWPFVPYIAVSIVHVVALAVGSEAIAQPTKLLLMPALALAVVWGGLGLGLGVGTSRPLVLLLVAVLFSWIGDGVGVFFPFLPELPMMLLFFGLAHVCYMWLFWRYLAVRRLPWWSAIYAVWWVGLLVVLWPALGGLAIPVAVYGLVLGGTAALATRCHPLVVVGGVFFLASDSLLAFQIFTPGVPGWFSPAIMATYTLGQGLIAAGALVTLRARATAQDSQATPATGSSAQAADASTSATDG